ncbi:hypothetical protein TRM7615_04677 [Falsiruegeria mediterranea M17]|uniref:Uncharacterized protein n=1 Tax=Falsiruegeria mediterranea M17 TaxID=1200281 RepID=A0A2R8CFG0_9RHOB|nr:hypothetical protein TRM7615_04677 [Falsiruegeria mediterranea M17]
MVLIDGDQRLHGLVADVCVGEGRNHHWALAPVTTLVVIGFFGHRVHAGTNELSPGLAVI